MRKILLTGLITDTGHYRHADAIALKSASQMLGEEIKHGDVLDLLRATGLGRSVRIATLRSLSNVDIESAGDFVVAVTSCSTHEGTVAGSLIHAGADDGKYHTFAVGKKVVGLKSGAGGVITLVVEDNQLSNNEQNTEFSTGADFIDFSESNPFGDVSNN